MNTILKIQSLNKHFDGIMALDDFSCEVRAGEILGVIGPNGSGKSTILKAIIGLIPAWQGSISLAGKNIHQRTVPERIKAGITYSPQGNMVFDELSVRENLEIAGFLVQKTDIRDRINEVLQIFSVE